jgi:hypothetical protein
VVDREGTNRALTFLPLLIIVAVTAVAGVRVFGSGFEFVPRRVARGVLLVGIVFAVLETTAIVWNRATGATAEHKNIFHRISDALVYLPWP